MRKMTEKTKQAIIKELKTNPEEFYSNAVRWIKAIKDGRMFCVVKSVSNSGMSRIFKYMECAKTRHGYSYLQFYSFFKAIGLNPKNYGEIRVSGCGMDMNFATNYNIIHKRVS